jgi:hypothetical protein
MARNHGPYGYYPPKYCDRNGVRLRLDFVYEGMGRGLYRLTEIGVEHSCAVKAYSHLGIKPRNPTPRSYSNWWFRNGKVDPS